MSTRRSDAGLQFDHGAQYFTASHSYFEDTLRAWASKGIVQKWQGRFVEFREGQISALHPSDNRYVGVPGMNAICKEIGLNLNIQTGVEIAPLQHRNGLWNLQSTHGDFLGVFDVVLVSAPAPQAARLLSVSRPIVEAASSIEMSNCWVVMVHFEETPGLPFDAAIFHDESLAWAARNNSKPDRPQLGESWLLQASPRWSSEWIDLEQEEVVHRLLCDFHRLTTGREVRVGYVTAHRWRYAVPAQESTLNCLFDPELLVGICGDWCSRPNVEGAFLSGMQLAERVSACLPSEN